MNEHLDLKKFAVRVRIVRAWTGMALGGTFGAVLALTWSVLDYFRVFYSEWRYLAALVCGFAALGALMGVLRRISDKDLAQSIDRRGKLQDRLSTSVAGIDSASSFREVQQQDAASKLLSLKPANVYPVKLSRWHGALVLASLITATLFLMGNSPLLMSSQQKADREDLQQQAVTVERVAKPLLDRQDKTAQEKALANQLQQYRDELRKARMSKPEAMQKADELSKQADQLAKSEYQQSEQALDSAQDALNKMQSEALKQQGLNVDPSMLKQLSKEPFSPSEEQSLQSQIDQLKQQLNSGKDSVGNKPSEAKMLAMTKQMQELEKMLSQIKLSQKVQDMLQRLYAQPEWKQLMKMMQELQKNAKAGKAGQPNTLTKEQLEEMKKKIAEMEKKLEELAERLKSDKDMQEFIKQLEKSLRECQNAGQCNNICLGLGLFNVPHMGMPGPGNGMEQYFANTHQIPLSKDPKDIKATADPHAVHGERQENGTETYIEVKGPSGVGSKSRTPYFKVYKQYRKQAEQALDRQQIPPDQQKRVKDYFDSLEDGQ